MQINILAFGNIVDITGHQFVLSDTITDTKELEQLLHKKFSALQTSKYRLAVNKQLVDQTLPLTDGATVAILPPFSGG